MLVANVSADTRHDCGGPLPRDQHRPLFDVQLEVGSRAVDVKEALTAAHALHLHTGTRHRFGKRARIVAMTQIEIFVGELAEQRAGAHVGLAEPRALLAAQAEHPHRPGRPRALAPEVDQAQQAGDDASESVEVATLRDGVQMRADINCGARWFVGKVDNEVLGWIACGRQSFALRKPLEEVERGGFCRTVAFARDAFTIARARRHVVKKLRGQRATRCAVHVSPGAPRPQLQRPRRICQAWSDVAGACRPACCGFGFLEGCDIGFWSSQRPSLGGYVAETRPMEWACRYS